jgi:acetyl esterase
MRKKKLLQGLPTSIADLLIRIGPQYAQDIRKHRDIVVDAFTPVLHNASKNGIKVTRNVEYGRHVRHRLDIFSPAVSNGQPLPVIFFVHGGAFVRGDKDINEEIYANVPIWFARNGFLAVNLEYRLAPEAVFPSGADDVASAIAWGRASVAQYGGDSDRMFLLGHSAGGTHVAHYAFDARLGYLAKYVRGIALVSARLRADTLPENPNAMGVRAYFGDDEAAYNDFSPLAYISAESVPTFVAVAEYENPLLDVYGAELFHRLRTVAHTKNRFMQMIGHNHMSIVAHFNTGEEVLGNAIIDFFHLEA